MATIKNIGVPAYAHEHVVYDNVIVFFVFFKPLCNMHFCFFCGFYKMLKQFNACNLLFYWDPKM